MRSDAQVVLAEQVAKEIKEWTVKWLKTRTELEASDREVMGPVQWLAEESGVQRRQIARITSGDIKTISEEQAWKILKAIDREYLLVNRTIHVIPNPQWSLDHWIEYMRNQGCI